MLLLLLLFFYFFNQPQNETPTIIKRKIHKTQTQNKFTTCDAMNQIPRLLRLREIREIWGTCEKCWKKREGDLDAVASIDAELLLHRSHRNISLKKMGDLLQQQNPLQ
jgi:hypothetical protein